MNGVEAAALLAAAGALAGGPAAWPAPALAGAWLGLAAYALARRWIPADPAAPADPAGRGKVPEPLAGAGGSAEPGAAGGMPGEASHPAPRGGLTGRCWRRAATVAAAIALGCGLVFVAGGVVGWGIAHLGGGVSDAPAAAPGAEGASFVAGGLAALRLMAVPAPFPWPVAGAVTLLLFQACRRDGRLRPAARLWLMATVLGFIAAVGLSEAPAPAGAAAAVAYGLGLGRFNARYTARSRLPESAGIRTGATAWPRGIRTSGQGERSVRLEAGCRAAATAGVGDPGPGRPAASRVPVVISGFYGPGNTGDEAILEVLLGLLRQRGYRDITVLSTRPEHTARRHGVKSVYRGWRRHWLAKARALLRAGVFISGGGGLLQDTTPTFFLKGPVPYYLLIATWARLAGCWVLFLGQGVGPLRGRWTRWLTRHLADYADVIAVRDAESLAVLDDVGVIRPPRRLLADFVFAAPPPDPARAARLVAAEGLRPGARRVVVSVRTWTGQDRFFPELAAFLADLLVHRPDLDVVLVPMEGDLDRMAGEQLAAQVVTFLDGTGLREGGAEADRCSAGPSASEPTDPRRRLHVLGT
ncbi:MAG TPA: polysaccharide pyruvyl transferase family protein, partial [Thermaerobacter sp.]